MIDINTILTPVEAIWRSSQTDLAGGLDALPSGEKGFERDVRAHHKLDADTEIPHVFCHDPVGLSQAQDWNQVATRVSLRMDLWTKAETQAAVDVRLKAFREAIAADPTLSGVVQRAWVSGFGIVDDQAMRGSADADTFREGRVTLSVEVLE